MNAPDSTTDLIPIKRCSRGVECVHPDGPDLPATNKFYYRDNNRSSGWRTECKLCNSKMIGSIPRLACPDGFKRCGKGDDCVTEGGPILPATTEYFREEKGRNGGLRSYCKSCSRVWGQQYAEKNPEYGKVWRIKNAETINARKRAYRKANPGKEKAKRLRREARKRELPATFTDKDWKYALRYFDGRCAYCGNPPRLFDYHLGLHQEHHIPVARGGGYVPNNILPACQDCNMSKNVMLSDEWLSIRFGRKANKIKQRLIEFFATVRQDTPAALSRSHLSSTEKAILRREDLKNNPPSTKCCANKENCKHPDGPTLPFSNEYFHRVPKAIDGLYALCKVCDASYQKDKRANRQRRIAPTSGAKYCHRGDQCINPDGPMQPVASFSLSKDTKDGLNNICKMCKRKDWAIRHAALSSPSSVNATTGGRSGT